MSYMKLPAQSALSGQTRTNEMESKTDNESKTVNESKTDNESKLVAENFTTLLLLIDVYKPSFNEETMQKARYTDEDPTTPAVPVDPAIHPMVVMCADHWNAFQRVMDETGTREKFRAERATVTLVAKDAIRILGVGDEVFIERTPPVEADSFKQVE